MTSTVFVDKTTLIEAPWLNDVDALVYQGQLDDGTTGASISQYLPAGTGAVATTVQAKLRESVSVKDFGAVGDGVTDDTAGVNAASTAVAASGGGAVVFPNGNWNWTFTKPPYSVTWDFTGPEVNREQLGGSNPDVRFQRARLSYIDGPHTTSQVQAEHIRAMAKGSNAIGSQYADYALGLTIEKENWSETSGVPVAGEINGLTIFTRNGAATGDPVKTGGAAILANVGALAGAGYTQVLEAVNTVFTRGTLAVEKQTNIQLLGIEEQGSPNRSWGVILNSQVGTQAAAIHVAGTATSDWTKIIDSWSGAANPFYIETDGRLRWRVNGTNIALSQDSTTHAAVFRNEAKDAILYATPAGYAGLRAVNVQTGTSYTIDTTELSGDLGKTVVLANAAAIAVTLPNDAPVGFHFEAIQSLAGQATFVAASGATLQALGSKVKTEGQHAVVHLYVRLNSTGSSAVWTMSGAAVIA